MTLLLVMEAVDSGQLGLDDPVTVSSYAAGMGGLRSTWRRGSRCPSPK